MKVNLQKCTNCHQTMKFDEVIYYGDRCANCEDNYLIKLRESCDGTDNYLAWSVFIAIAIVFIGIVTCLSRQGGW